MARAKGIPKIRGRVGNMVFYAGPKGQAFVRAVGNMDKERFDTHPLFEGSRRATGYMKMASQAGAGLRQALAPFTKAYCDRAFTPKLVGICQANLRQHHPYQVPAQLI
jgi:hypothetical protein